VRSERCRERLLALGVDAARVAVGADWAWLYRPRHDRAEWARAVLDRAGRDRSRPLVLANVVNEIWSDRVEVKRALARALDVLVVRHGVQVAFFCNESRDGAFYDQAAAASVRAHMTEASIVVPSEYYTPDEALSLVAQAAATVSSRYHFTVQSILAGRVPVTLARSEKMTDLLDDLDLTSAGTCDALDADALVAAVARAVGADRAPLATAARRLAARAAHNLDLWPALRRVTA
jgi:polysaccharide pyruvyl transferase WcaK-like protein